MALTTIVEQKKKKKERDLDSAKASLGAGAKTLEVGQDLETCVFVFCHIHGYFLVMGNKNYDIRTMS